MAVVATDVTTRAKEFSTLTTDEIDLALADAALQINANVWGTKSDLATIYLAAHILSIWNPSLAQPAAPVSSETVGSVSRSYAVGGSATGSGYESTRWGQEYKRLQRQLALWSVT